LPLPEGAALGPEPRHTKVDSPLTVYIIHVDYEEEW